MAEEFNDEWIEKFRAAMRAQPQIPVGFGKRMRAAIARHIPRWRRTVRQQATRLVEMPKPLRTKVDEETPATEALISVKAV